MTSIFTYETEPLKVVSPWPKPIHNTALRAEPIAREELHGFKLPTLESIEAYHLSKLEAEPQEGPVEYKLHLLLRPRRNFTSISTTATVGGSHLSRHRGSDSTNRQGASSGAASPSTTPNSQIRQNRLQHLTTQLLWRLQQSSPNHSSTKTDLVIPVLPDSSLALYNVKCPGPLVAGLEESKGALYEIGVSDSGAFVGLTLDELEESLQVLAAMANSIGCKLRILKMVIVGKCRWQDKPSSPEKTESLWVTEIFVGPTSEAQIHRDAGLENTTADPSLAFAHSDLSAKRADSLAQQMRVSLTGSTTSGKSSLLGTLSTSTLDNGRGKSRLSLLRHRHEIVSGVTSSLAQELIGYQDVRQLSGADCTATTIVNYASPNTSSWTDIHNSSNPGRLIFLTDSAGHPKFRRTTVRGLISWAPHWTLCCIAADDDENSAERIDANATSSDILGSMTTGVDLSKAHLELCLNLDLPLVCVVTKLDLASRNGLRQTVSNILSTIKRAGRKPVLLASTSPAQGLVESQCISRRDEEAVKNVLKLISTSDLSSVVPIVLTSALSGLGIGQVHSLLHQLPIDDSAPSLLWGNLPSLQSVSPRSALFHIDEIFAVGELSTSQISKSDGARPRYILSGYLRYGSLQVGDDVLLGPFAHESQSKYSGHMSAHRSKSFPGLSKSLPKDFTTHASENESTSTLSTPTEVRHHAPVWQVVRITSLRHLRLPVRHLSAGQVGTIAIWTTQTLYTNAEPCLRRGMVICHPSLQGSQSPPPAYRSISAVFADPNIYVNPGSTVTLYTASIRATAKIAEVKVPEGAARMNSELEAPASHEADSELFTFDDTGTVESHDSFALNEVKHAIDDVATDPELHESLPTIKEIEITFRFINSVEWVEMGTKLLVTPASGISMLTVPATKSGSETPTNSAVAAGLDGFVGRIVHGEP